MPVAIAHYDDLLHHVYDNALVPAGHGVEYWGNCFTHQLDQSVIEAWTTVSSAEDPFVQAVTSRNLLVDGAAFRDSDLVSPIG